MTIVEFTDFENDVNQEILKWASLNPELIQDCNGKQDVARAFWEAKIMPLYEDGMEIIESEIK